MKRIARITGLLVFTAAVLCAPLPVAQAADTDTNDAPPSLNEDMPADQADILGEFHKLEDVLRWTYTHNPALRAARAELAAVEQELPQALAGWKPTISGDADVTANTTDGSNFGANGSTSKGVGIAFEQPLYRGGRTISATDSAQNLIRAQEALLESTAQDILLQAATVYMNVLRDKAVLELSANNRDFIGRQLEATRQRFEVGELTVTDVSQAEARYAEAESNYVGAAGNLRKSKAAYEKVVGVWPAELGEPEINLELPETLDGALALAEDVNPQMIAATYIHRSSEEDIDVVFGELLPELEIFGGWDRDYDPQPGLIDETTSKTIGISARIPFYSGGAARARVRQAKHVANQRYLEIFEVRREVQQAVISSWENLATARAEVRFREAQVKAAETARKGVHEEAELGARTILDALDADREYLDAQVAHVTAQSNRVIAVFDLAASIGVLSPKTLGFSGSAAK